MSSYSDLFNDDKQEDNNQSTKPPNGIDVYRTATIRLKNNQYHVILLDIAKDQNNMIRAINNSQKMVKTFPTITEAIEFIEPKKHKVDIDYIISDIMGLVDDYIFIPSAIRRADKSKIFNIYRDSYQKIMDKMHTRPSRPLAGQTFEQDRLTGEYFFYMERLNIDTFAVMFSVHQVFISKTRQLLREIIN